MSNYKNKTIEVNEETPDLMQQLNLVNRKSLVIKSLERRENSIGQHQFPNLVVEGKTQQLGRNSTNVSGITPTKSPRLLPE